MTTDAYTNAKKKAEGGESPKTMVDTYKDIASSDDSYNAWASGIGKDKIKQTGKDGKYTSYDMAHNYAMYQLYQQQEQARKALEEQKKYLEESKTNALGSLSDSKAQSTTALEEQKKYLEQSRQNALDANAQGRADTMRENSILTERAKEYAQRRAALNGTASAGVSQSSMIDILSQMAGARADAQASYDNQERTIVQEYMDALNQAQGDYNEAMAGFDKEERSIIQDYMDAVFEAQNQHDTTVANAQNAANTSITNAEIRQLEKEEAKAEVEEQEQKTEDAVAEESHAEQLSQALEGYKAGTVSLDDLKKSYKAHASHVDKDVYNAVFTEYDNIVSSDTADKEFRANNAFGITNTSKRFNINSETLESDIAEILDVSEGSKQTRHVQDIIENLRNGAYEDGEVINMNYGINAGSNKGNYFVYYKGKLYQTSMSKNDLGEGLWDYRKEK